MTHTELSGGLSPWRPESVRGSSRADRGWLILGATLLLGAGLRLANLGHQSLWGDEINVAVVASGSFRQVLEGAKSHVSAPPGDYLLVHLLSMLAGKNEFVLRLGAVAWGILSIPLIYLSGRRIAGRWAGLLSAMLLACSPMAVFYSRELRFYSALVFFSLLSNVAFLRALDRRQWRDWTAYCTANCIGIYFHPFVGLIMILQGAYLLLREALALFQRRHRFTLLVRGLAPYLMSLSATALSFVPWALWDLAEQTSVGKFHTIVSWPLMSNMGLRFGLGPPWSAALLAALVLIGAGLGMYRRKATYLPILLLDLAGVGLVILMDNLQSYWFDPKQALFALPAYLTLSAVGLAVLGEQAVCPERCRRIRGAAMCALLAAAAAGLTVAGTISSARDSTRQKEDWRGVGEFLARNVQQGDWVVQVWLLQPNSLGWYFQPPRQAVTVLRADALRTTPFQVEPGQDVWWVLVTPADSGRLKRALGDAFEVEGLTGLSVARLKGGVQDSLRALDVTVTLLELQSGYGLADPSGYHGLAQELLRSGGRALAQFYVQQGSALATQGDWTAAAKSFQRAVVCWPDWGLGNTALGNAYRALGQLADAEAAYLRSMEVEPGYAGAYINLGGIREMQGQSEEALRLYRDAVRIAPGSAWGHSTLGGALLRHGDSEEALGHLRYAVELEPDNANWLLALADGLRELGRKEEAADLYRQVLALEPGNQRAAEALKALQP